MGIVLKRAQYFITCKGKHYGLKSMNEETIRNRIIDKEVEEDGMVQLSMFDKGY